MLILDALSCTVFIERVVQRKILGGKIKEPKIWAVHRGGAMWGFVWVWEKVGAANGE